MTQDTKVTRTMICGATAGIVAKTCIAPFERVKISFQVSNERFNWKSFIQRFKHMLYSDGFFGLWKGHSMTVIRVAPYASFSYTIHDATENFLLRHKYKHNKNKENQTLHPIIKFLIGSFSGACSTLLTYPLDVLRVKLAMRMTLKDALKEGGYYNGITPTLLGIIPYSGTAWLIKQTLLESYKKFYKTKDLPKIHILLAFNAIAGLTGQFFTYPLDILRRKMQLSHYVDGMKKHTLREVFHLILKTEGLRGFTKGFSINLFKGPVALSISFTIYDYLKHIFIIEDKR